MKCPDCKREGAYYRIKKQDIACNKCGLGILSQPELKELDGNEANDIATEYEATSDKVNG